MISRGSMKNFGGKEIQGEEKVSLKTTIKITVSCSWPDRQQESIT